MYWNPPLLQLVERATKKVVLTAMVAQEAGAVSIEEADFHTKSGQRVRIERAGDIYIGKLRALQQSPDHEPAVRESSSTRTASASVSAPSSRCLPVAQTGCKTGNHRERPGSKRQGRSGANAGGARVSSV